MHGTAAAAADARLGGFQDGLTAIPDGQLLVLSGPSVSAAGRALRVSDRDRGERCHMRLCKSDNLWVTQAWTQTVT